MNVHFFQKIFLTRTVLWRVTPHSTSENGWPYVSWLAKFVQCCFSSVWWQSAPALQPESYSWRGMYRWHQPPNVLDLESFYLVTYERFFFFWEDCILGGNSSLFFFHFSSNFTFCDDRAISVEFESVKVEGYYRFDFVYQKKLLTAEQLFCFLPVSCSAAETYRQADMSAFNRPRWSF